jgi:hypothetical protein
LFLAGLFVCIGVTVSAAELRLGQASVPPGAVVGLPVTLDGASGVVGAQFDVSFDSSSVSLTGVSAGAGLAGHIVDEQELAPGHWRVLVYSTTNGPISPGTVVSLNFNVPSNAPDAVVPLAMTNAIVAKVGGQPVQPLAQVSGVLVVTSTEYLAAEPLVAGGQLRTTIVGLPGRVFTLQGTPDLFHWADLGRYTNQSGTLVLTNVPPAGRDAYFYRTVFRPGTNPPAVPAPTLSEVARLSDGRTRFELDSTADTAWRIEGSPDLFHWGNYGVVTNQTGSLQITNTPYRKPGVYFYRAAQP